MDEKRLFVGNLPHGTSEDDVRKFFTKFKVSAVELKHKPGLHGDVKFAFVNIPEDRVPDCLEQCRSRKLKDSFIKIEVAKESFLDRLQKERDERKEKSSSKNKSLSPAATVNTFKKNRKITFNDDDQDGPCFVENCINDNSISTAPSSEKKARKKLNRAKSSDDSDHSDEVPRKRNLPMFRGIASVDFTDDAKPQPNLSMKKFEEFSDVWRDVTPEKIIISNSNRKLKWKQKETVKNSEENPSTSAVTSVPRLESSKNLAEAKRMNALQEKWNAIKEKKETIRKALKNVSNQRTSRFIECNTSINADTELPKNSKKLALFEDDASDDDCRVNFEPRKYLDGKNGLKLLNLKSRLSSDDRFTLDDRFCDDNDAQNAEDAVRNASDRLNGKNESRTGLLFQKSLIRYDPTRPDHQAFEKQLGKKVAEKKKKVAKNKTTNKNLQREEKVEISKPEVSKEKHYTVADSLKDAFKSTNDKTSFSLSAMFDEKIKQHKKFAKSDDADEETVPIKKLKLINNPFENTVSDDEDEVTVDEMPLVTSFGETASSEKIIGKCGVWGETFFFKPNDSRLQEAVNFYSVSTVPKRTDFDKERCKLKLIVRKKLQNSRRDKKLFQQKLGGGKLNKVKFQKRLKKARS